MINKEDVCLVLYDNSYNDSIEICISSLNNEINFSFSEEKGFKVIFGENY